MHHPWRILSLLSALTSTVIADQRAPIYPAPLDLSSKHSLIPAAWRNLTSIFDGFFKHHINSSMTVPLAGAEHITFSTGLFSIHDPKASRLQYHYTSPEIAKSKNGTSKVDADSIYRMASSSKLFTVYAGLVTLTEEEWNTPLAKLNPALAQYIQEASDHPLWHIQWNNITPWTLASQESGIPVLGGPSSDILWGFLTNNTTVNPTAIGFPASNLSNPSTCYGSRVQAAECTPEGLIESNGPRPPTFLPWWTPSYADNNYEVLGALLSNITGKPTDQVLSDALFTPLNLTSTFYHPPKSKADQARSVVPGDPLEFYAAIPFTTPSGGLMTTLNDLNKFAASILKNTLLTAEATRKWMKPQSHTASLTYSVGAPWEIVRYVSPTTGKVTDIYTKLGDSGPSGSLTAVIPDFDAGFTLLAACSNVAIRSYQTNVILDYILQALLPALEAQATLEAAQNFVGTYESTRPDINSSITIGIADSSIETNPYGLSITEFISNGTNAIEGLWKGQKPRLLLSIPKQTPDGESGDVAFQTSTWPQTYSYFVPGAKKLFAYGPFSGQYRTNMDFWAGDGSKYYDMNSVNKFVFSVDGDGKATAVTPAATKAKLKKK